MIIVSQDKSEMFNFDEIFRLYIDTWSSKEFAIEPDCWCIKAEKASDNMICAFLGEYATEERAKEVLREIVDTFGIREIRNATYQYADIAIKSRKYSIYKMPKE